MQNGTIKDPLKYLQHSVDEIFSELGLMEIDEINRIEGHINFDGKYLLSMIGLVGDYTGVVSIYCDSDLAILFVERMLGMELDIQNVDDDVRDAIGEITNMVVGRFKIMLNNQQDSFRMSIPSVINGDNFTTKKYDSSKNRLLSCKGQEGTFYVQLYLKE